MKAKADFKGKTKELHLRVASYIDSTTAAGAGYYYDLSNPEWEAIKRAPEGRIVEKAPIIFRRYNNQQPQE